MLKLGGLQYQNINYVHQIWGKCELSISMNSETSLIPRMPKLKKYLFCLIDAEYSKLVSPPYLKNDGEVSPDIESLPSLTRQSSQSEVESVLGRPLSPDVKQQLTLVEMEAQVSKTEV